MWVSLILLYLKNLSILSSKALNVVLDVDSRDYMGSFPSLLTPKYGQ